MVVQRFYLGNGCGGFFVVLTKAQVIKKIGKKRWKEFEEFITGQTVVVADDGSELFQERDVEVFLSGAPRWM